MSLSFARTSSADIPNGADGSDCCETEGIVVPSKSPRLFESLPDRSRRAMRLPKPRRRLLVPMIALRLWTSSAQKKGKRSPTSIPLGQSDSMNMSSANLLVRHHSPSLSSACEATRTATPRCAGTCLKETLETSPSPPSHNDQAHRCAECAGRHRGLARRHPAVKTPKPRTPQPLCSRRIILCPD